LARGARGKLQRIVVIRSQAIRIANGWIGAQEYYRALAESCGVPFKAALEAGQVEAPGTLSPRQCLAKGLLKERMRARSFVIAPEGLRPNALREMLTRLQPYNFSIVSPGTLSGAIRRHFARSFARYAVEGLPIRHPGMSARERPAAWQRLALLFGGIGLAVALMLAPVKTIWAVTLALAVLFVAVIAFRIVAAYGLVRGVRGGDESAGTRIPDHELPIYSVLVPLYREAHICLRSSRRSGSSTTRLRSSTSSSS
jgi:glycosyltransferase XagB